MRSLADMVEDDKSVIGHLMLIAHQLGTNFTRFGYRLVINEGGDGCENYGLVMFHLMGSYQFNPTTIIALTNSDLDGECEEEEKEGEEEKEKKRRRRRRRRRRKEEEEEEEKMKNKKKTKRKKEEDDENDRKACVVNVAGYPCHPDVADRVRTLLYSVWWSSTEPVFKQIAHHEIEHNLTIIYEDSRCIAWEEKYHKVAPLHYKLVPKMKITSMDDLIAENKTLYGHFLLVAGKITKMMNLTDGYRIHVNTGPLAEQFYDWLYFDIFADRRLGWPPGK
ncbi:hypothetical protein WDU94_002338 [Cyamophila willieti]